jgi:hypothetical protein
MILVRYVIKTICLLQRNYFPIGSRHSGILMQ